MEDASQALSTIVDSTPVDLAVAGWLDAHSKSKKTQKAYADTLQQFRRELHRIGRDLDSDVRTLAIVAQRFAGFTGNPHKERMNMDDIDELLESFRILYTSLEKLRQLEGPEFVLPGRVDDYHRVLEEAYAAYDTIESRVDELGQQLEAEHVRLDEGVKKYG